MHLSPNTLLLLAILLQACCCLQLSGDEEHDLALVSLAAENRVSVFELEKRSGKMERVFELDAGGDAGSQFFDAKRSVLYLGLRNAGKIAVMQLDRGKKKLKRIDEITVDPDPAFLYVDHSGRWLLAAYYATGRVSVHGLNRDGTFFRKKYGSFTAENESWLTTAPRAHAIVPDASNRFVFVPHTGPNRIYQFRLNPDKGRLFPSQPPHLSFPEGTGPRHLVAHPTRGEIFFCINEQGSSVTLLRMDPKRGTLQPLQTVSTLPTDFDLPNACADLEISKDGRFLYGANRGHDSIALFQLLKNDELVRKGIFKTEKTPRQFSLSPDNKFLVSAGQGSDRLAIFRVDPASGRLKRTGTQATGKKPWWITLID